MPTTERVTYAWCFVHASLHVFAQASTPWCTAAWAALDAADREAALTEKQTRFGAARFFDELPREQQLALRHMEPDKHHPHE
ncbi:hypothetical protein [Streptomyces sp. TLI_146]|uniref:hypothetical protein n=1 Tax=Streptomyces sp. TLI_146 TaxID=1938858 RepID=UPI000C7089D1|nr:hypothetical protein [Streptomyces sp. TLI_146]PKV82592.1 hypothetical protein BX283_0025 [Streptomyces sp. TLI_146]